MNLNNNHQIGFAYYPNSVFKVYTSVHFFYKRQISEQLINGSQ